MSLLTASVFLILLLALSAFVSAAEIAIAAGRKIKLQIMAKEGDVRAFDVLKMQENPGSFITVVQVVLNAVAISAGAVGESAISPYLRVLVNNEAVSSVISFVLITSLFSLLADLMPRRLAMSNTENIAVRLVRPMMLLIFVLKPVIWIFDGAANVLFEVLGISTTRQDDMTPEDIYAVMDAGAEAGVLKKQEHHLIENIFDMQERTVTSVMNPRENIVYFDTKTSTEKVVEVMIDQPHNKFLVCHDDDLEHIVGYVESRSFLALVLNRQEVSLTSKELLMPALFVPDTLSLFEVLEMFKSTGSDFAVIVNEYGLVVGVITLKDVMSIVMGELVTLEEQPIVQRTDNSWLIDGMTPIEDVVRALDIVNLPRSQNYETLSGFMMYMLRKIPKKTDTVEYANYRFEIIATDNLKITQMLVTKIDEIV
ncbi:MULTISPECIES: hemolysin family protein [unclassified Psychrobacter]|uniref:hemolysin family protein n=1 Tax=unclassified Psychrobacter TaxID=196806 RepID=UPI0018CE780C|nr:hemolysin family protein [Psychrobacter sp. SZ93C1]MBH0063974.1 HlyC/CorC family transporter [Psychrobacter sp. SZ93C1]